MGELRKMRGKTTLEKLVLYNKSPEGDVPLTAKEQEQMERINYADNLLNRGYTDREVANAMKKKWPNFSYKTFLNDCNDARFVHSSEAMIDKSYYRKWMFQRHLKTHRLIEDAQDWMALVRLEHVMAKTLGLDKDDDLILNPADYGNHNFYFILNAGTTTQNNYVQVNLNSVEKIPESELNVLKDQIEEQFLIEQEQLLKGFKDDRKPQ